jgi:hypothetical protein
MAVPMANDPPFATLNHFAADLGIPSESDLLRIGISRDKCDLHFRLLDERAGDLVSENGNETGLPAR